MLNSFLPDGDIHVENLRKMAFLKLNEENSAQMIKSSLLMMSHLSYREQECIPSASSACLNDDDFICTIYRGIHDLLAMG